MTEGVNPLPVANAPQRPWRRGLKLGCVALLLALSCEIVLRRFIWQQLPSQVPGWAVYLLLLQNVLLAGWLLLADWRRRSTRPAARSAAPTRN